jgi:hypothetical protein
VAVLSLQVPRSPTTRISGPTRLHLRQGAAAEAEVGQFVRNMVQASSDRRRNTCMKIGGAISIGRRFR